MCSSCNRCYMHLIPAAKPGSYPEFRFLRCLFKAASTIIAAACRFLARRISSILTLNSDKQASLTCTLPLDAWNQNENGSVDLSKPVAGNRIALVGRNPQFKN